MYLLSFLLIQIFVARTTSVQPGVLHENVSRRDEIKREAFEVGDKVYNCNAGCDMNPEVNGSPVCAENQVTYFNECLAVCQGVKVSFVGECPGDHTMSGDTYDTNIIVSKKQLNRFKDENFFFIARRKFVESSKLSKAFNKALESGSGVPYNPMDNGNKKRAFALRVTAEGDEYYAVFENENLPVEATPYQLPLDINSDGPRYLRGRNMGVVGPDTRSKVCLHESCYPYSTIGEFDSEFGGEGGCTGTVVSRTSVLTAAHCHYLNGSWTSLKLFAPGRYSPSIGVTKEPYGIWKYETRTVFTGWQTTQQMQYDIAIVKIAPKIGYYIGDFVGWMGLSPTTNNANGLQTATVTGYPFDKNHGEMWTSGPCPGGFISGYDPVITYHNCDTVAAESGSALLDLDTFAAYGVHVVEVQILNTVNPVDAFTNVGVILHETNFAAIRSWAGWS